MEEVKIWEKIIQWGISKDTTLPLKPKEWSNENYLSLRNILQHCLPHIRYFQLSNTDLWEKVKPYKKILDEQLWDDLMQHQLIPDKPVDSHILPARLIIAQELPKRTEEPFSTVINSEHIAEISTWIDRKDIAYSVRNIPYEFQLILRGSRDGFNPQTFWDTCHGHSKTVTVLRVAGTDEILGGYNPLAWDKTTGGVCMATYENFVFSLKNGNIQNSILSRLVNIRYSAVCNANLNSQKFYGPDFIAFCLATKVFNFTQDKQSYCRLRSSYNAYKSYEKDIRTEKYFSIIDYEVFKIISKTTS